MAKRKKEVEKSPPPRSPRKPDREYCEVRHGGKVYYCYREHLPAIVTAITYARARGSFFPNDADHMKQHLLRHPPADAQLWPPTGDA
jgi:hypothetical protein